MSEELDLKNKKQAWHLYRKFTRAEGKYKNKIQTCKQDWRLKFRGKVLTLLSWNI